MVDLSGTMYFSMAMTALGVLLPIVIICLVLWRVSKASKSGTMIVTQQPGIYGAGVMPGSVTTQRRPDGTIGVQVGGTHIEIDASSTITTYSATGQPMIVLGGGMPGVAIPGGGQLPAAARLAPISAHDPALTPEVFYATASAMFFEIMDAWSTARPDKARSFMDDGMFGQFKAQADQLVRAHRRNVCEQMDLKSMDILTAQHTDAQDSVIVRCTYVSTDYDIDAVTGDVVRGDVSPRTFIEDWALVRAGSAITAEAPRENACSNCGAPLASGVKECGFCHTAVVGAQDQWRLARIDRKQ